MRAPNFPPFLLRLLLLHHFPSTPLLPLYVIIGSTLPLTRALMPSLFYVAVSLAHLISGHFAHPPFQFNFLSASVRCSAGWVHSVCAPAFTAGCGCRGRPAPRECASGKGPRRLRLAGRKGEESNINGGGSGTAPPCERARWRGRARVLER